jgi:limonene-1,2-epoxide hydrolase
MKISRAEKNLRNENAVRAFLKGWDDRDVDACMSQCAEHMCYLNQPLEAIRGKENVRKMIASIFAPAKNVEFDLINVFGSGNRVITERLDKWDWDGSGTWQLKLPVCGMFELTEDGKLYEWREYYDNQHWTKYGGPSLVL